jgi:Ran GTPase-activating protein (RanGAP) involved in mRNA processing and transport
VWRCGCAAGWLLVVESESLGEDFKLRAAPRNFHLQRINNESRAHTVLRVTRQAEPLRYKRHVSQSFMSGILVRKQHFNFTCDAINLNEEALTDEIAWNLLDALRLGKFTRLTRLHLDNNMITDKGGLLIAQSIRISSNLKWLYLGCNHITDTTAIAIADALRRDAQLHWIDLSGSNITETGALALSRMLCVNTSVQELYLNQNQMGDKGACAFAEALDVNYNLRRLGLGNNQISDVGARRLAASLCRNITLQQLWLDDNRITDAGGFALCDALRRNSSIEWLDVDSSLAQSILKTISSLVGRNTLEPLRAAAEVVDLKSQPFIAALHHNHRRLVQVFGPPLPSLPVRLYAPPSPALCHDASAYPASVLSRTQRLRLLSTAGSAEFMLRSIFSDRFPVECLIGCSNNPVQVAGCMRYILDHLMSVATIERFIQQPRYSETIPLKEETRAAKSAFCSLM